MRKLALLLFLIPCPALACSICGTMSKRVSLAQEFEQATVIVYGKLANPKLDLKTGGGTTEFHFDKIIKDHRDFPRARVLLLNRYLPVLDAKDAPRYVMFFGPPGKTTQPYNGRQISQPAILDFVHGLSRYRDNPAEMLRFAAKHLDDADPLIAEEAFLVFARGDDKVIGQIAKEVSAPMLRKLIKSPDLEPERLGMYAYLLGAAGNAEDAEALRAYFKNPAPKYFRAYEGILAGYIMTKPKEGWAFAHETLKSDDNFVLRYAVLRTMRFFYNANPEANASNVLHGESLAIARSDIADVAITDLSRWKRWEHTKLIVSCYDKQTHRSPLIKSSIVRYALACPQLEARGLVERVRREDPKLLKYLEEELK